MKKIFSYSILFSCLFLSQCKKAEIVLEKKETKSENAKTAISDQIPPQILKQLISDYLKKNDSSKALELINLYDTISGVKKVNENTSLSAGRSVPGVGSIVLDGGMFYEASGNTSQHVQGLGWSNMNFNAMNLESVPVPFQPVPDAYDNTAPPLGSYLGTVGQGRRLEAFTLPYVYYQIGDVSLGNNYGTDIFRFQYSSHVSGIGWMPSVMSPNISGTVGQGRQIEAVKIKATQNTTILHNSSCLCIYTIKVFYRAHVYGLGWLNWVSADVVGGTVGLGRRLEALQIRVYFVLE